MHTSKLWKEKQNDCDTLLQTSICVLYLNNIFIELTIKLKLWTICFINLIQWLCTIRVEMCTRIIITIIIVMLQHFRILFHSTSFNLYCTFYYYNFCLHAIECFAKPFCLTTDVIDMRIFTMFLWIFKSVYAFCVCRKMPMIFRNEMDCCMLQKR